MAYTKMPSSLMLLLLPVMLLLLTPAAVEAHFKVTAPPARFKNEASQVFPPCGGVVLGSRTPFPISGGIMQGTSYHPTASMSFSMALTEADPQESDFSKGSFTSVSSYTLTKPGDFQIIVDLSSNAEVKVGTNATLRIRFDAGDGILYQCSDVTFTAAQSAATTAAPVTTATGKNAASARASSSAVALSAAAIVAFALALVF
ncbi:hypothetical protein HDU96_005917 [Phlyctochytrium bullatum]|nr:hypothetical protein HDU96_005917 [Phlyctochytrium bullatum]